MWRSVRRKLLAAFPQLWAVQRRLYRLKPYASKFRVYYLENAWGGDGESRSGTGSSLRKTANLRRELPLLLSQYRIQSILDVPCGDFHWMKEVDLTGTSYLGVDIVDELITANRARFATKDVEFRRGDFIKETLPRADLVDRRDCFIHYPFAFIARAILGLKASGSTSHLA